MNKANKKDFDLNPDIEAGKLAIINPGSFNEGTVYVKWVGSIFATVENPDTGYSWDVVKSRLKKYGN